MVRLAPRIQIPWAVGAISTGAPASTATASPCPMPAAARPPAMRSCPLVHLGPGVPTGVPGSPVVMPLRLVRALANIVSVNLLTKFLLAQARWRRYTIRSSSVRPSVEHHQKKRGDLAPLPHEQHGNIGRCGQRQIGKCNPLVMLPKSHGSAGENGAPGASDGTDCTELRAFCSASRRTEVGRSTPHRHLGPTIRP